LGTFLSSAGNQKKETVMKDLLKKNPRSDEAVDETANPNYA
jgi:hypothetical protein